MDLCERLDLPRPYAVCSDNRNCSLSQQAYGDRQNICSEVGNAVTPGIHVMASFCSPISSSALGFYEAMSLSGEPHTTFVFALEYRVKGQTLRWKIYRQLRQFELLREELKRLVANSSLRLPRLPGSTSQGFSMRSLSVGSRGRSGDDDSPAQQHSKLHARLGELHRWLAEVVPLIHGLLRNNKLPCPSVAHWLNSANGRALVMLNCFLFSSANIPTPRAASTVPPPN